MERLGFGPSTKQIAMDKRYERHYRLQGMGVAGQERLSQAKVLVVGVGGLGSAVLYYLAAAGVGTLGMVDYDRVEVSNLQRQILHSTSDLARLKVDSAAEKLQALNPELRLISYAEQLTEERARELFPRYDYVLDCSDNYETKFLINDLCVELAKPYTHAAVLAMKGEVMTYLPGHANYRDVFAQAPAEGTYPAASEVGVLGSVVGIVGSIQATEALKYFTGLGSLLLDRLLLIDGLNMQFVSLKVRKHSV